MKYSIKSLFLAVGICGVVVFGWKHATERWNAVGRLRQRNVYVSYSDVLSEGKWLGSSYTTGFVDQDTTFPLGRDLLSGGPVTVLFHQCVGGITDEDVAQTLLFQNLKGLHLISRSKGRGFDPGSCSTLSESLLVRLGELRQLHILDVRGAQLSPRVLDSWGRLEELQELGLLGTNMSDDLMKSMPLLPALTTLDLSNTQVTEAITTTCARFPRLTFVDVRGTRFTGPAVSSLQRTLPVNGPSDFHRVCLFSGRRGG